MKTLTFIWAAITLSSVFSFCATAESRLASHGFTPAGVFHLTTAGPAEIEVSTNLHHWTKLATVSQEMTLEDAASRRTGWRFYRPAGGSNVVGFVRVSIPAGKMAILGNPFTTPLRLDTPEQRHDVFGTTNPAVKISIYANGNFTAHTFDKATGNWSPALRPIRPEEGFAVENVGPSLLQVKMAGEVRHGHMKMALPAGPSLVVPPVPEPGPIAQVLGIPGKDGTQIDYFNEETQKHEVSTYDSLSNGWMPKLPDYTPGRALLVKTPAPVSWTNSFPATAR